MLFLLKKYTLGHHTVILEEINIDFFVCFCLSIGTDEGQAQFFGPDCQILGFAGMYPEDPSCGEEDLGLI